MIRVRGAGGHQGERWSGVVAREGMPDPPNHVIVATPTETHEAIVTEELNKGNHVLCEKPLAMTAEAAERLYDLAEEKGLKLWVCYPHLYDRLSEPKLLELHSMNDIDAECVFRGPTPREPLLDWGIHAVTAALTLIGNKAVLSECAVALYGKRAHVVLKSQRGVARCEFGESFMKTTRIKVNAPQRWLYTGAAPQSAHERFLDQGTYSGMDAMGRLLMNWAGHQRRDRRQSDKLTIRAHELLDEVIGRA